MEALVLDLNKRYSYADYLTWMDDVRRELIDGFINMMAGTSRYHGEVSKNIFRCLDGYTFKNRCNCKVYYAPIDVLLPKNGEKAPVHTLNGHLIEINDIFDF